MPRNDFCICLKIEDLGNIKVQNLHYDAGGAQLEFKSKCNACTPVSLQI